ncbi:MAG TPA: FAD-dependent oxidoreductase [Holophagaceae bacterium]|nr:FAD-dependent oxidoreductase [Holophagaceae bacterium]
MKIAVIGSGISGLSAAWLLSRVHEVTLFEKEDRIGGHTHTHSVATPEGPVAVDTGFIVHNRATYPNFCRLMAELGIDTTPSDMSFAAQGVDLPWCSRGLNGLFCERRHLIRPRFYGMWKQILRFNREAMALLDEPGAERWTLGAWLDARGFDRAMRENYLLPMAGAVWSTTVADMEAFPAVTLARFFQNHGFLGVTTQHPWRTIPGGTSRYIPKLLQPLGDRVLTGASIRGIRRDAEGVTVSLAGQGALRFDHVVLAVHGDQTLPLLADATELEREVLGVFRSNPSPATLHTDTGLLPRHRRAWASWNYRPHPDRDRLLLTYHMNRLQPLATKTDLFVTLHGEDGLDPSKVQARMAYEHPRYDLAAIRSQARWADVSGRASHHGRTHFAGAYWAYGFHEDGLNSGIRVARDLGVSW